MFVKGDNRKRCSPKHLMSAHIRQRTRQRTFSVLRHPWLSSATYDLTIFTASTTRVHSATVTRFNWKRQASAGHRCPRRSGRFETLVAAGVKRMYGIVGDSLNGLDPGAAFCGGVRDT